MHEERKDLSAPVVSWVEEPSQEQDVYEVVVFLDVVEPLDAFQLVSHVVQQVSQGVSQLVSRQAFQPVSRQEVSVVAV